MCFFFFFKHKTAYEFRLSLVGSEMCIRDSNGAQAMKLNNQNNMQLSFITRAERQIVFRKKKHATAIRIDIIDNGPGIKNELIDKIFFPLVTGNENGSGLGLSLCLLYTSDAADE